MGEFIAAFCLVSICLSFSACIAVFAYKMAKSKFPW